MSNQAYINIEYSEKKNILIDYFLFLKYQNSFRTTGISSAYKNLEFAKEKLSNLIKDSKEQEIVIKSTPKLKIYSKMGKNRLKEITNSLKEKRPDITFKLEI